MLPDVRFHLKDVVRSKTFRRMAVGAALGRPIALFGICFGHAFIG